MDLSKIDNNLKKAYEKLNWEERKKLLDNLMNSIKKQEISFEEFDKLILALRNSCPIEDASKWVPYWIEEMHQTIMETYLALARERILRKFNEAIISEIIIGFDVAFAREKAKTTDENIFTKSLSDYFCFFVDDYMQIKKWLCENLIPFGLTPEQEETIMQGSISKNRTLIFDLVVKEPDYVKEILK